MELEPRIAAPAHATGVVEFVPLSEVAEDAAFRLREAGDVSALAASIGRLGQLVPIELRPLPGAGDDGPRYQVVAGFRRLAALRMLQRGRVLARVHGSLGEEDAWGLALGQALLTEPLDRDALERLRQRLVGIAEAEWADELLDDALVRAPVEPELRERFFEFLGSAAASPQPAGEPPVPGESGDGEAGPELEGGPFDAGPILDGERGEGPRPALVAVPEERLESAQGAAGEEAGPPAQEVTPEELVAHLGARLYEVNADLAVAFESWFELPEQGRGEILEQVRWLADLLPQLEKMGDGR